MMSPPATWQDASGANDQGHFVAAPAKRYNITGLTGGVRYDVEGARQNAAPSGNLSDWTKGETLAPTRKAIVITPSNASKAYGAADPAVAYPLPNFLARHPTKAHVFTADPFAREPGENAGEYNYRLKDPLPWVAAGNPEGAYSVSLDGRSRFTISKKEVTYTSTAADKTYDGNVNAPSDLGGSFTGVVTATVNGVAIDDTAAGKLSLTGGRFRRQNRRRQQGGDAVRAGRRLQGQLHARVRQFGNRRHHQTRDHADAECERARV